MLQDNKVPSAIPVRIAACALLLWSAGHRAAAADRPPPAAKSPLAIDQTPAKLQSDRRVARPVPGSGQFRVAGVGVARPLWSLGTDRRSLGRVRDGIGMDYRLGELGGLQLNLYSRHDSRRPGRSWNLNAETPDAAAFWLLGGSLDLARDRNDRQQVVFVPRLMLDFDALTESDHRLQAFVQYAPWHSSASRATPHQSVAQVAFRLRF